MCLLVYCWVVHWTPLPEDRNQTGSLLQQVLIPCLVPGQECPGEAQRGWSQPAVGHGLGDVFSWTDLWQIPDSIASLTTELTLLRTGDAGSPRTVTGVSFCLFTIWSQLSFPPYLPLLCLWPSALCPYQPPSDTSSAFTHPCTCSAYDACLSHSAHALGPGWNATSSGGLLNPCTCMDSLSSSFVRLVITHRSSCPAPACWLGRCATHTGKS